MDEVLRKIEEQNAKLEEIRRSVAQVRKYMLITAWVTIIVVVLPLIGLFFAVPAFLSSYGSVLQGF